MSSINRYVTPGGKTRWLVRYRTPDGKQRGRAFATRRDAERHLTSIDAAKISGDFVDPRMSKMRVDDWADKWLAAKQHLAPNTRWQYGVALKRHVKSRWGDFTLDQIRHEDVQEWVNELGRKYSSGSLWKIYGVFSMLLKYAVRARRLSHNPAENVELPRRRSKKMRFLTHAQVEAMAQAAERCRPAGAKWLTRPSITGKSTVYVFDANGDKIPAAPSQWGLIVRFLAYTGLRFGELAALRVRDLRLLHLRVHVVNSVSPINGKLVWSDTKSHEARDVPIPAFLRDALAEHIAGKSPDDLVFPSHSGAPLRSQAMQLVCLPTASAAIGIDPPIHPHEFRHTAASLAIAAGADVKVIQQMLGHKTATMTLDRYGHLLPDRLDTVAAALNTARASALAQ
jgi:integrase